MNNNKIYKFEFKSHNNQNGIFNQKQILYTYKANIKNMKNKEKAKMKMNF